MAQDIVSVFSERLQVMAASWREFLPLGMRLRLAAELRRLADEIECDDDWMN